jgi:hypothetical protein
MRILFTIPHYFRPSGQAITGRKHGSVTRSPQVRVSALTACVASLHQLFSPSQCVLEHASRLARRLEPSEPAQADVVVCTAGTDHLLDQLRLPAHLVERRTTTADPLLLGYECHSLLRERLGRYDYYCYLEDDLILSDPWLFRKLAWFNRRYGDAKLLQPNRFESGPHSPVRKIYVDGALPPLCTAPYQEIGKEPELVAEALGVPVVFRRTSNPHAGCFFLSASQMEHWAGQPYFLDRATSFIGALESAATLGIMRAFEVYKPGLENGDFLEVQHHGTAYLDMVRGPSA